MDGNKVVSNPTSGPIPKVMSWSQNWPPNSPGGVFVMWLRVASRFISA